MASRFVQFTDAELSELLISLDHRKVEAQCGNAYVWTVEVNELLSEVEAEERHRHGTA